MTLLASQSENLGKNQAVDKDPMVKDDPLREDIRLLGRMLGDTLREQEGEPTFELIENIRQTAIRFRREQDLEARHELDLILNQLSNKATEAVVRAFSHFSQLSNIAEDLHHNRRRRMHLRAGSPPQAGSIALALIACSPVAGRRSVEKISLQGPGFPGFNRPSNRSAAPEHTGLPVDYRASLE